MYKKRLKTLTPCFLVLLSFSFLRAFKGGEERKVRLFTWNHKLNFLCVNTWMVYYGIKSINLKLTLGWKAVLCHFVFKLISVTYIVHAQCISQTPVSEDQVLLRMLLLEMNVVLIITPCTIPDSWMGVNSFSLFVRHFGCYFDQLMELLIAQ